MKKLSLILFAVILLLGASCSSYKYCPSYSHDSQPQEKIDTDKSV